MVRGGVALLALMACALVVAVVAVPTARRIRVKTARAHLSAHTTRATRANALTRAFTCAGDFITKAKLKAPLRQDPQFLTFCADSIDAGACSGQGDKNKPLSTWKEGGKNNGRLSEMGLKKMLDWQTAHAQNSFRFMIIAASKAMSGWSAEDKKWYEKFKNPELPDAANGQGWANEALIGKPKGMGSAWRKVSDDTNDGYHYDFTRLVDGLRASFVFADASHVEKAVCWFRDWVAKDKVMVRHKCSIVLDKDRWTTPIDGGYSDFMLSMQCTWGDRDNKDVGERTVIVEIQFHACGVLMAKQGDAKSINAMLKHVKDAPTDFDKNGHELYEAARELKSPKDDAAISALNAKMSELYTNAKKVPNGKCDISKAPKFRWEGREAEDYEEEDLTEEVAKQLAFVNAANIHGVGWKWV